MPVVDFLSQTYEAISPQVSSKRTVNMYLESTEGEGKSPIIMIGTPGTEIFTTNDVPDQTIVAIQGNGTDPNTITVETASVHNFVEGQLVNIEGTTSYDEEEISIAAITSPTTFIYFSTLITATTPEVGGVVLSRGPSAIAGVQPTSGCRGLYTTSTGRLFGCFQDKVFEFFRDGSFEVRFSVTNLSTRVHFADTGFELGFVDGRQYKVLDLDTNIVETVDTNNLFNDAGDATIPDSGFQNPINIIFSNQRLVLINSDETNKNNNKFFWTELLDAKKILALNFASAESSADPIISLESKEGEIYFFGPRSYEAWRPDINPDLPFTLVGGTSTEIGCGSPDSTANIAGEVFWLGSSRAGKNVVYKSNGYNAQRISNHALEYFLDENNLNTSDAVAFTYQQAGHIFYVISFIQAQKTFCYDVTTNTWHERATRDQFTNVNKRWAPLYATFAFDQVICGADDQPLLLTLNLDRYVEWDGRPIVRLHQGPIYWDDYREMYHQEFQVDMQTGVGLQLGRPTLPNQVQDGQGSDPVAILSYSDDGGFTWSAERFTNLGKVGQYKTRARWRRLGRSRERVYRLVISDPVKVVLIGARLIASLGRAR